jgi:hypothetical protein
MHIVDAYLEKTDKALHENINRIINDKWNTQINELATVVFGGIEVNRLSFYTEKGGEVYANKDFDGFIYARGLNCLLAFLLVFRKDIQELFDLILVRGQWISIAISLPISEGIMTIAAMPEAIMAFDDSLSDTGSYGSQLKTAIRKVTREHSRSIYIKTNLDTVNREAQNLLVEGNRQLFVVEKGLKLILDDYRKEFPELILNWKALEPFAPAPLDHWLTGVYGRLSNFVQLLQLFIQSYS